MIDDLVRGQEWLFSGTSARRLLATLRSKLSSITRNIYVLGAIPEPYEDIYDLLVDGTIVVRIEIPRVSGQGVEVFEKSTVEEYLRTSLGRPDRRKLQLAIQLAQGKHSLNEPARRGPLRLTATWWIDSRKKIRGKPAEGF
jgi:hypothetical protein